MQLNFKKFGEARPQVGQGFPVIILHGLLGSLDNWQTLGKKISESNFTVYIPDQRNHGRSPHSDEFSYQLLADDLLEFCNQQKISKTHLIGHSMGGKAVMKFALEHGDRVEKLVVVDIAPVYYADTGNEVFRALYAADVKNKTTREEVQSILREKFSGNETLVQFLMKGLQRSEAGETGFGWKFNLDSLSANYDRISEAISSPAPFTGKTLFIKGENSTHINTESYAVGAKLFPNSGLREIKGSGHWVHADKPVEFLDAVAEFLKE